MKKNMRLDTKGFLLMETLLVSLTIAGILLYMYVQYSRITDSYHRLSRYNSVESLYRAGAVKRLLQTTASKEFYDKVDRENVYEITSQVEGTKIGLKSWGNFLKDLEVSKIYVVKGDTDLGKTDASFIPFLKTVDFSNKNVYRIYVKYVDGSFATVTFEKATNVEGA